MKTTYFAVVTIAEGYGERIIDIVPVREGEHGLPSVLRVALEFDDDGRLATDIEGVLAEHGWRTAESGKLGHWIEAPFGMVSTVERIAA